MSDIGVGKKWTHKQDVNQWVVIKTCKNDRVTGVMQDGRDYIGSKNDFVFFFEPELKRRHSHYHKDVSNYQTIDVYAVCKIFDVQDPSGCLQHAIKKLLVTGQRGYKDRQTDIQNAIDTLNRLLELEQ